MQYNGENIKIDLKNLAMDELSSLVSELGEPGFRAKQIFSWLYRPGISSFEQMTNLSKTLRTKLQKIARISHLKLDKEEKSEDGTIKYAFKLDDDFKVEAVLIPDEGRNTLCISSQVGCAMACDFCLTGTMGIKRNLTPAEIVNQVTFAVAEIKAQPGEGKINNLVFMGMGEPLANLDNVICAINILTEEQGLNFSDRRITVSTCGLVPQMAVLGQRTTVNLAVSLHAASDEIRNQLMPVNKKYSLEQVIDACIAYPLPKRRRIMIEYILIKDINDSINDARQLVKILHNVSCKVNLLPYNESPALPYRSPLSATTEKFQQILKDAGFTVLVRQSRGADISAACGQLVKGTA